MNGRVHGELKDGQAPPEDVLRTRLNLLDGSYRFCFSVWRLPEGVPFDRVKFGIWPEEYVQAAGSKDRMTVEIRRSDGDVFRQYVIGRALREPGDATEIIEWDGHELRVQRHEVFTADEAADVFSAYVETASIPDELALREILVPGRT